MEKLKRPVRLPGDTYGIQGGCGRIYVTVNKQHGKVVEIFSTTGKSGQCATAQMEALTRSITVGLRFGVPLQEYVDQLKDIKCPTQVIGLGEDQTVFSCPDALAKVLNIVVREQEDGV